MVDNLKYFRDWPKRSMNRVCSARSNLAAIDPGPFHPCQAAMASDKFPVDMKFSPVKEITAHQVQTTKS